MKKDYKESKPEVPIAKVGIDINKRRIATSSFSEYKEKKMWQNASLFLLMNDKAHPIKGLTGILGESLFLISLYAINFSKKEVKISTGDEDYIENFDFLVEDHPIEVSCNLDFHTTKKNTGEPICLFLPSYANQRSLISRRAISYNYQGRCIEKNRFNPSRFLQDTIDMNREVVQIYNESIETGKTVFKRDYMFEKNFKVGEVSEEKISDLSNFLNMLETRLISTLELPSTIPSTNLPVLE